MIAFLFQFIFGIARTINVQHIAKNNLVASVISGTAVAILWVLSTRAGINAFNSNNPWEVVGYIAGAASSVLIAMRHREILKWIRRNYLIFIIKINSEVKLEPNMLGWRYKVTHKDMTLFYYQSITPNKSAALSAFIQWYLSYRNL